MKQQTTLTAKQKIPFGLKKIPKEQQKLLKDYFSHTPVWDFDDIERFIDANKKPIQHEEKEHSFDKWKWIESIEGMAEVLRYMGFHCVTDTVSGRTGKRYGSDGLDRFQQWAHPAGVYLKMDSYGKPINGYHKINSLHLENQIDIGSGMRLSYALLDRCPSSSSSFSIQSNGGNYSCNSYHETRSYNIWHYLKARQEAGRFVPFHQWDPGLSHLHLSPEMFINDAHVLEEYHGKDTSAYIQEWKNAVDTTKASLPDDISALAAFLDQGVDFALSYSEQFKDVRPKTDGEKKYRSQWRFFEEAFDYNDWMSTFSLKRYPSEQDQRLLKAWFTSLVPTQERPSSKVLTEQEKEDVTEQNGFSYSLAIMARLGWDGSNNVNILNIVR